MTDKDPTDKTESHPSHEKEIDGSIFDRVLHGSVIKGRLKNIVGEMKLPKEIVAHIMSQVDETKHAALGIVAKETRLFLEKTNLADELAHLLTQISFEVKTQVRFVPSDKASKKSKITAGFKRKKSIPPADHPENSDNEKKNEKDEHPPENTDA